MKKYRMYEGTSEGVFSVVNEDYNYLIATTIRDNFEAFRDNEWSAPDMHIRGDTNFLYKLVFEFNTLEELENHFIEYLI